jgi:hypothetical protein
MDSRLTNLQVDYSFQIGGSERTAPTPVPKVDGSNFLPRVGWLGDQEPLTTVARKRDIFCFNSRPHVERESGGGWGERRAVSNESAYARYSKPGKRSVDARFSPSKMITGNELLCRPAPDRGKRSCAA